MLVVFTLEMDSNWMDHEGVPKCSAQ